MAQRNRKLKTKDSVSSVRFDSIQFHQIKLKTKDSDLARPSVFLTAAKQLKTKDSDLARPSVFPTAAKQLNVSWAIWMQFHVGLCILRRGQDV